MFGWFNLKSKRNESQTVTSKEWKLKSWKCSSSFSEEAWLVLLQTLCKWKRIQKNHQIILSFPAFCFSPPVNHTSICPPTACVQFQDHDFILGCLADFPAVLLEEFLAEKHFVPLSVFSQAQLTKFLPAKPNKTRQRKGKKTKISTEIKQRVGFLCVFKFKLKIYGICMCVCKNR